MAKFLEHIFGVSMMLGFKAGDLVKLKTTDSTYANYTQMMKRHPQYALRWVYKGFPNTDHLFQILRIYPHVRSNPHDENQWCVIVQDVTTRQIYMVGEYALEYVDSDKR